MPGFNTESTNGIIQYLHIALYFIYKVYKMLMQDCVVKF